MTSENPKLDYQTPLNKRRFRWPADWRRRLLIASLVAPITFALTFDVARRNHRPFAVVNHHVRNLQAEVDAYTRQVGHPPATLTEVPVIEKLNAQDSRNLIDPWLNPYVLVTVDGKPTVMSYSRDGRPGGRGLDADVTVNTPFGRQPPTVTQFIQTTNLPPVIFTCVASTVFMMMLCFTGTTDTRAPRGLVKLLLSLLVTGVFATIIGGLIASVHGASGH